MTQATWSGVEVGGDVDWLPMRAAGVSLVIRDVTMSGA